jgi:hypothetical protein
VGKLQTPVPQKKKKKKRKKKKKKEVPVAHTYSGGQEVCGLKPAQGK